MLHLQVFCKVTAGEGMPVYSCNNVSVASKYAGSRSAEGAAAVF